MFSAKIITPADSLIASCNAPKGEDEEETEDILQNAFINVWRNINSFDDSLKFSSFLYRIVHNETITQWRKIDSSDRVKQSYDSTIIDEDENVIDEDENTKNKKIKKILDKMPLKYKEVLVLKFLENMDYEEISNILKIPEGTVATRINRAKKSFVKISENQNLTEELLK